MNLETGMLVKSRAGHDEGSIFVIIRTDGEYVYVADGKNRTVRRPKKKNRKHLQVIRKVCASDPEDDINIRKTIRHYTRMGEGAEAEYQED